MKNKAFQCGNRVWVIIRDIYGEPMETQGQMLLAITNDTAFLTPYVFGLTTLDEHLAYHRRETLYNQDTALSVYPLSDCYTSKEEAEAVIEAASAEEE